MMRIYNTLTKKSEELIPRSAGKVQMFVCGPTVYDLVHIGNARTFVFFDAFAKYLRLRGLEVEYLQNITDIDDKIIAKAQAEKIAAAEVANEFEKEFMTDMSALGVTGVTRYARATDHIPQVIEQVKKLINSGHAYQIKDGWYFDVKKFAGYGKLSGRSVEMAEDGVSRIDESGEKRNKGDFCVWKLANKSEIGFWEDEELGYGRPGWHIEDTAITEHYFGPQYDIHGGGQDLIFPHHEAEITQQESASGLKPFVKYWLHVAFLVNKDKKMSKSKSNFTTAHELLEKYPKEVLRFYLLSGHYRQPLEFSEKLLNQSAAAMQRIKEFLNKITLSEKEDKYENPITESINKTKDDFKIAMNDDFNTPRAIAEIFGLIRGINSLRGIKSLPQKASDEIIKFFDDIDAILGIIPTEQKEIPVEVQELVNKREKSREEKNYDEADKIRAQINDLGYEVEDTIYGPLVVKK